MEPMVVDTKKNVIENSLAQILFFRVISTSEKRKYYYQVANKNSAGKKNRSEGVKDINGLI